MKFLALETSSDWLSLALFDGPQLVAELSESSAMRQAELLVPKVKELLQRQSLAFQDLEAMAVSLGPGSFTGLRVGLAFAKGAAFAQGLKLVGISSLQVWAESSRPAQPELPIAVLLDGRRGLVFRAQYRMNQTWQELLAPALVHQEQALQEITSPALLTGDVWERQGQAAEIWNCPGWLVAPQNLRQPSAAALGRLAWPRLQAGQLDDAFTLEPHYLRRSEAEIKWESRKP